MLLQTGSIPSPMRLGQVVIIQTICPLFLEQGKLRMDFCGHRGAARERWMQNAVSRLETSFHQVEQMMKRALMKLKQLGYEPDQEDTDIPRFALYSLNQLEAAVKEVKAASSRHGAVKPSAIQIGLDQ